GRAHAQSPVGGRARPHGRADHGHRVVPSGAPGPLGRLRAARPHPAAVRARRAGGTRGRGRGRAASAGLPRVRGGRGLNILLNAGPWLPVPPPGYGGIENVVATLIPELRARGVHVVLASVGESTIEVDELISVYATGQFPHLQKPYNQVMGIAHAHQARVAAELRRRYDIDLVHDHVAPYHDGDREAWVGSVGGEDRDWLYASARASLFPIQWDELGGTAVVEPRRHRGG